MSLSRARVVALTLAATACLGEGPLDLPPVADPFSPASWVVVRVADATRPTQATWGPDGRLYVAGFEGGITVLTFDDTYRVVERTVLRAVEGLSNSAILGIAVDPRDPPEPVRIYVAHSALLSGVCGEAPRPYSGQVSVLTGPTFDVVEPVVIGLPASILTHGVNGIAFDDTGDLLIAIGGQTNAGVPSCDMGGLPESPLSGSIVRARMSRVGFRGDVAYVTSPGGVESTDQQRGDRVDLAVGSDVAVFAAGLRNAFDLVVTGSGRVYATDNGPNELAGSASISATEVGPDPVAEDELNLIFEGAYYGHPNRNRGRADTRQNVYASPDADPAPTGVTQPLAILPASSDGIDEYRSTVLGDATRGALVVQQWDGPTWLVRLDRSGDRVTAVEPLPFDMPALDVVMGPGGALIGTDFTGNGVWVARPVVGERVGLRVFDVSPYRLAPGPGRSLVIGGNGFARGARVWIGGAEAQVLRVTETRIHVTLPSGAWLVEGPADVVVLLGFAAAVLKDGVRLLAPR